jgi:transposase
MAIAIPIQIKESESELLSVLSKAKAYQRARVKMLLLILRGTVSVVELAKGTKSGTASILTWKKAYNSGGLEGLLADKRGGDKRSEISSEQKQALKQKLSDPKAAFRSYDEARSWAKEELGIDKEYHAFNKYLKRNFGTSLKVGRKSHTKKDGTATADYKKPSREA